MRLLYIIHKLFFSVNEMMKIPMQTFMCVYTYIVLRTSLSFLSYYANKSLTIHLLHE